MDIKNYSIEELEELCSKIRTRILEVVSRRGGHLSSTLGAVELIVAMHYVFDPEKDPFIFDVSHQAYAHKLLTGRWEEFDTLRQLGGISGYTKPTESSYDYYVAGHSSTSISLAVGAAKAGALKKEESTPVALIGDGAMSAGMVYEALNELGDKKYPVVIILNDNEMSISKPIGAISKYLSQKMAEPFYQRLKKRTEQLLSHLPESATYLAKRFEESLRLITPGILFEELGIEYIGPIDGHDLEALIETYKIAKELKKPVLIHTQTLKGKGYKVAEGYYEHWHGVGPFDIESGEPLKKSTKPSATSLFSEALMDIASKDQKVVGVTAAMPSGTGMKPLLERFPDRFWDVAIAEQHAVTSMGPLAKEGFKPFVAIYSTFLQRGYDQVIHDIALMNVPVAFAIDRAGIVGEDGETHQGVFDVGYLRIVPNLVMFAPRDASSMRRAVEYAYECDSPCAFRYPRGSFLLEEEFEDLPFVKGRSQMLIEKEGDTLFIGYGNGVGRAYEVMKLLDRDISLLDLRFVKPLDENGLKEYTNRYKKWFVFSDNARLGGVASALGEFLSKNGITEVKLYSFEYEDRFIPHGKTADVERFLGLGFDQLAERVEYILKGEDE